MKSIAELAREKLRKLEQMVHPAKPDPGSKKIKNGQVLKRKQSKVGALVPVLGVCCAQPEWV